jgi:palmitoyl-protein thioesterase
MKLDEPAKTIVKVDKPSTPVIVFGGMGSKCDDPAYTNLMTKLKDGLNTHVECFETTIMDSINLQAENACKFLKGNDNYNKVKEFNVMGVSQGGLIARSVVEWCDLGEKTKPRNLLTVGTPNLGFSDMPDGVCEMLHVPKENFLCTMNKELVKKVLLNDHMQSIVGPAGYYRDSEDLEKYRQKSKFLARLNNEIGSELSEKNKENIKALNGFMMVMFNQDEVISPRTSQMFGDDKGSMFDQEFYKNDNLGLKYLNDAKKLEFVHIDAKHV